jgi:hypothetical protein
LCYNFLFLNYVKKTHTHTHRANLLILLSEVLQLNPRMNEHKTCVYTAAVGISASLPQYCNMIV